MLIPKENAFIKRTASGQSVVVLMLVLAMFAVAPLGFFSYEMARYNLAKQQLAVCVQSAALAAGTGQASSNSTDPTTTQNTAMSLALNMFQQNTVIGVPLTAATSQGLETAKPTANPSGNQSIIAFEFLDPNTRLPVSLGSPNGKIIQVYGFFGFVPAFHNFLGISNVYPIEEISNGGLPMLDVILCFDISASMDDFTNISAVDRYNNAGTNAYAIITQGPLYTAFSMSGPTGTALNATVPQTLDDTYNEGSYRWCSAAGNIQSQRGTNNGQPAPAARLASTQFTDLVVNIDGTSNESSGITINGFDFPANNVGVLVEAARGNLESVPIATTAHVPYSSWGVAPGPGWYNAYVQGALAQRHPIQDAIMAAQNFFSVMNNDCDAHFGLVTFSSAPGTSSTQTCPADNGTLKSFTDTPSSYPYTSNVDPTDPVNPMPPNPGITLNPTTGAAYSNYSTVNTAVTTLVAYGATDIAGALQTAVKEMTPIAQGGSGLTRAGATKAIVLFTDGLPTSTTYTPSSGNPSTDARSAAGLAAAQGVPVYCIGLCLTPGLQASQTAILTDQANTGIAYISGNGAKFYQATQLSELNAIFENVARSLVQLVH